MVAVSTETALRCHLEGSKGYAHGTEFCLARVEEEMRQRWRNVCANKSPVQRHGKTKTSEATSARNVGALYVSDEQ